MKTAVLFGGTSAERDVSLASGIQVVQALREHGHEVIAVDTARGALSSADEQQLLAKGIGLEPPDSNGLRDFQSSSEVLSKATVFKGVDVVFIALHGGAGEDGTIQASLDLAGMTYTGSGHEACANALDKDIAKRLFRAAGVATADWLKAPVRADEVTEKFGYPVVVKPNKQGSSVGLTIVHSVEELMPAIDLAYKHDNEVMIEQYIDGRELTVGILDEQALEVGEIIPLRGEVFDYESKYQQDGAREIFPADISGQLRLDIQRLGLHAHQALKLEGFSRVDFRMDKQNKIWCLEANTVPGLTAFSLLPKSAQAADISFPELCDRICQLALKKAAQE